MCHKIVFWGLFVIITAKNTSSTSNKDFSSSSIGINDEITKVTPILSYNENSSGIESNSSNTVWASTLNSSVETFIVPFAKPLKDIQIISPSHKRFARFLDQNDIHDSRWDDSDRNIKIMLDFQPVQDETDPYYEDKVYSDDYEIKNVNGLVEDKSLEVEIKKNSDPVTRSRSESQERKRCVKRCDQNVSARRNNRPQELSSKNVDDEQISVMTCKDCKIVQPLKQQLEAKNTESDDTSSTNVEDKKFQTILQELINELRKAKKSSPTSIRKPVSKNEVSQLSTKNKNVGDKLSNKSSEETMVVKFKNMKGAKKMDMLNSSPENTFVNGQWVTKQMFRNKANDPRQLSTYLQPQDVENISSADENSSKTDENNPLTPTTGSMDDTFVDSAVRADHNDSTLKDYASNMPMYYTGKTMSDADLAERNLYTGQNSYENEREYNPYDYTNNDDMESVTINADSSSLEEEKNSLEQEPDREYHENKLKNNMSPTTVKNFTEIKSNTYRSPNKHKIHNQEFLENIAKKLNSNKSSVNQNNKNPIGTIQKTKMKTDRWTSRKPILPDDLPVYENIENLKLAGKRTSDEHFITTSEKHDEPNNSATTNQMPTRYKNTNKSSKNIFPLSKSSEDIIEILKKLTNKSIQTTSGPLPLDTPDESDEYLARKIPRSSKHLLKSSLPKLDEYLGRTSEENDEENAVTEKYLVKNNKAQNKSIKTTFESYKNEETKKNPKVLEILQRMKSLNGPLVNIHLENESYETNNDDSKAFKDLDPTSQKLLAKNKYNTQSTGKLSQSSLENINEKQQTMKNVKLSKPFLKSLQPFNSGELLAENNKSDKTTTTQISLTEYKNNIKKLKNVNPIISNKFKSFENITNKVSSRRLTPLAPEPKLDNSDSAEENTVKNKTPFFVRKAPKILLKPLEKSALSTEVSKSKRKPETNHNESVNSNCSENGSCNKSEEENKNIVIKEIIAKQKEVTETVLKSNNKNRFDNKRRYSTETVRDTYDTKKNQKQTLQLHKSILNKSPTPSLQKYSDHLISESSEIGRNDDNTDIAKNSHTTKKQFTSLPIVAQEKLSEDNSNTIKQKKTKLKTSAPLVLEKSSDIMSDDGKTPFIHKTNVYTSKDGTKQVYNGVLQSPQEEHVDMTNETQIPHKTKSKTTTNASLKLDAQLRKDPEEITQVNDYVTTDLPTKSKKFTKLPTKSLIKTMSATTTPSQEEFAGKTNEHSNAEMSRPLSTSKLNIHSTSNPETDLKVNATKRPKISIKTLVASKKLPNKITTTSPSLSSQETGEDTNEYLATKKLKLSSNPTYSSNSDLHLEQTDEDNTNVNDKSAIKKSTTVNPKIPTSLLAQRATDDNSFNVPKKLLKKIKPKVENLNLGIISANISEETPKTNSDEVLKKNSNTNDLLSKRPLNKFLGTTPISFSQENPDDSVITKILRKSKPLSSRKLHSITMSAQPTQLIPENDKYSDETITDNNDYKATKKIARNKKITYPELLQLNSKFLPNDASDEIEIVTTEKPPKMSILRSKSFQPLTMDKDPNDELVENQSVYDTANNHPLISDSENEELYITEQPINLESPNEIDPDEILKYNNEDEVEENENVKTFEPESIDEPKASEENLNSPVEKVSKLKPKSILSSAAIRDRLQSYTSNKSKPTQIKLQKQNIEHKAEEPRYSSKLKSSNTPKTITKTPTSSSDKLDNDEYAPYNEEDLTPIRFEELTKTPLKPNTNVREHGSTSGNLGSVPRPYRPTTVLHPNHEDHYDYSQYNKNDWRETKPNSESSKNEQPSNNYALESPLSSQIPDESMDNVRESKEKIPCQSRFEVLPQVKVLNGVFKIPLIGRKDCDSANSGYISDIFVPVDKSNEQHSAISLTKLLTGDFRLLNGHDEHSLAMEPVSDNVDHSNMVQLPKSDKQAMNSITPRDIHSNKENDQEPVPPIHIIQIINNGLYLGTPNDTRQLPKSDRNDEDDLKHVMLGKPQIRTYVHNGQNNEDLDSSYNHFDSEILDKVLQVYAPHMIRSREGYQFSDENVVLPEKPKEFNVADGHCPVCHVDPKTEHNADSSEIGNEDDGKKNVRSNSTSCPVCHKKERETTIEENPDQQETQVEIHQADANQEIENEFDPNEKPIMSARVKILTDILVAMKNLTNTRA